MHKTHTILSLILTIFVTGCQFNYSEPFGGINPEIVVDLEMLSLCNSIIVSEQRDPGGDVYDARLHFQCGHPGSFGVSNDMNIEAIINNAEGEQILNDVSSSSEDLARREFHFENLGPPPHSIAIFDSELFTQRELTEEDFALVGDRLQAYQTSTVCDESMPCERLNGVADLSE